MLHTSTNSRTNFFYKLNLLIVTNIIVFFTNDEVGHLAKYTKLIGIGNYITVIFMIFGIFAQLYVNYFNCNNIS